MTDLTQPLADLSPAQRALLEQRLMERLTATHNLPGATIRAEVSRDLRHDDIQIADQTIGD